MVNVYTFNGDKRHSNDSDMPCNKKGCTTEERASCCGCPEQIAYERKKKAEQMGGDLP